MKVVIYGMSKLTPKQKKFINEYVKTRNAEQSAINAGYTPATARGNAHKLLQNIAIKNEIHKRLQEADEIDIFDGDRIIRELLAIGYGESFDEIPVLVGEGVQEIVQVRTPDATRRASLNDAYKLIKASGRDELLTRKLELEIQKLEQELSQEQTTEDKLSHLIESVDKLAGDNE